MKVNEKTKVTVFWLECVEAILAYRESSDAMLKRKKLVWLQRKWLRKQRENVEFDYDYDKLIYKYLYKAVSNILHTTCIQSVCLS